MTQDEAIKHAIRYCDVKGNRTPRVERARRVLARHKMHLIKTRRLFVLPLY